MNYKPNPFPTRPEDVPAYLDRELRKISGVLSDQILYRTLPANQGSLTAGIGANWKIADGNVIRISASTSINLTGIQLSGDWTREVVLVNVGTGSLVLLSENAASSASFRFALPRSWTLSANDAAILWTDPYSTRLRGISRT